MAKAKPETQLVNACLQWLEVMGITAWRNNSGAMKTPAGGFVRFGKPGSADILGLLPASGRFLAVECKVGKNKPTDMQRDFLKTINRNGGVGIVVYTLDDLSKNIQIAMRGR